MIVRKDFDEDVSFLDQLKSAGDGPITLINTFTYAKGKRDELIEVWKRDSEVMKARPGFISAQLYAGELDACVVTNVAVWQSAKDLLAAHSSDAFREILACYPEGTVSRPTVMRPVAVDNICVA